MKNFYWTIVVLILGVSALAIIFWPKGQSPSGTVKGTATNFEKYAQELILNQEQFGICLSSGKYEEPVKKDYQEGVSLGVSGTPTIFINSRRLVGAQPLEEIKKAIEEELASPSASLPIVSTGAAVKGPQQTTVTINEFSDYQCPYCATYAKTTVPQILQNFGNRIKYVFHDFPLPFHQKAQKAAEAARCAGEQGKYWEYHDLLFEKQTEWEKE